MLFIFNKLYYIELTINKMSVSLCSRENSDFFKTTILQRENLFCPMFFPSRILSTCLNNLLVGNHFPVRVKSQQIDTGRKFLQRDSS